MSQAVRVRFEVFNGTDGSIQIQVYDVSRNTGLKTKLDTTNVARAFLTILSSPAIDLDSADEPTLLTWNITGLFTAVLGGKSVPEGTWKYRLIVVDTGAQETQLVHEDVQDTVIRFNTTTLPD